jgi:hypothetical protein
LEEAARGLHYRRGKQESVPRSVHRAGARECGGGAASGYLDPVFRTLTVAEKMHGDPRWCARLKITPRNPRAEVDRVDFDPTYDPAARIECEICGNEMLYTAACKIMCGTCGYKRDCSDP